MEKTVWNKVATTLTNSDILQQSINDALLRLEERKKQMETESEPIDRQLEKVRGAIGRYGIAFADGVISEDIYREKIAKLKKQEADLAERKANLDPEAQLEVIRLEDYIAWVKKLLDKGGLVVESDGIWAYEFSESVSLIDAENFGVGLDVDETVQKVTRKKSSNTDSNFIPLNLETFRHPKESRIALMRAILRKFDIKVFTFPHSIEIRGFIPTQVIGMPVKTIRQKDVGLSVRHTERLTFPDFYSM